MSTKRLSLEDFDLSPDELKTLVEGSQKFLPPEPEIDEKASVDSDPPKPTS